MDLAPAEHVARDSLTNCETRAAFESRIADSIARAESAGGHCALIFLDIDHFKSINDAFGHLRGDRVLAETAARLMSTARRGDHVFRMGGDEFALVLAGAGREDARRTAERLLAAIREAPYAGDPPLKPNISIGAAIYPEDGTTPEQLYQAADQRHYRAKRSSVGSIVVSDDTHTSADVTPPSRLIERDSLQLAATALLTELRTRPRGMLRLVGPPGSGWTRALTELHTIADLLGNAVLALRGSPAVRMRLNGAFSRAIRSIPALAEHLSSMPAIDAILAWLAQSDRTGLLVTIDDIDQVDAGSLEKILQLLSDRRAPPIAVALASAPGAAEVARFEQLVALQQRIDLAPISHEGLRVWLRQSLRWEPSDELLEYLSEQTGGLPGPLWRLLRHLITSRTLARHAHGWALDQHYRALAVSDPIERRGGWPALRLPTGMPEFIGRAEEVATLIHHTREQRLVALVGPGGIGKTRLAIQVAAEAGELTGDGALFIGLSTITATSRVVPLIAEAIGVASSSDMLGACCAALRHRRMVLLIDNLEHLPGVEHIIRTLADRTEQLRIVLTSRERPALSDALVVELAGLSTPADSTLPAIDAADASYLFTRRAMQVKPSLALRAEDAREIERICRLTSGMPLAIELAAGWVTTSTCREIADQLAAALKLGPRRADSERQSVVAVVEAFWLRLSSSEQAVLRRLGLFFGPFSAQAAQAIASASPFFLGALVVSGYLRRAPDGSYEFHELLRQYAAAQLERSPADLRRSEALFAEHYTALMQQSDQALIEGGADLLPLRREITNIMVAWDWSIQHDRVDLLLHLAPRMARYWEVIGLMPACAPLLDAAIVYLRDRIARGRADDAIQQLYSHLVCRRVWSDLLVQERQHDHQRTLDEVERLVRAPEAQQEILLMRAVADVYVDPAGAYARLSHACTIPGSSAILGECVRFQGIAAAVQGDLALASELLQRAYAVFELIGDRLGMARTLVNLVFDALDRESLGEADAAVGRLAAAAAALGSIELQAVALLLEVDLAIVMGDADRVARVGPLVAAKVAEVGVLDMLIWVEAQRCSWLGLTDEDAAAELCGQLIEQFAAAPEMLGQATFHEGLAAIAARRGRWAEAHAQLARLSELTDGHADPTVHATRRAIEALCALRGGDVAQARQRAGALLRDPAAHFQRLQNPYQPLELLRLVLCEVDPGAAPEVLAFARERLERRGASIADAARRASCRAFWCARYPELLGGPAVL